MLRRLLTLLVCHQEPSVTVFLPLLVITQSTTTITPEAVPSDTTTITPKAAPIKAKPGKVPHKKVPQKCKEFIEPLATVESHYGRAKHRDRKFVEPGTTLQKPV